MEKLIEGIKLICQYSTGNGSIEYWCEDQRAKQSVEYEVMSIFTGYLEGNGKEPEQIKSNYKKLRAILHPDYLKNANIEVQNLEAILSKGQNDGALFKLLGNCFTQLEERNRLGKSLSSYSDIHSVDELLARLEQNKTAAQTLTGRAMIDSITFLIQQARNFHQTTDSVDKDWLRMALTSIPYVTGGFCLCFFIEELALIYALTYLMTKGGFWISSTGQPDWQQLGFHMASYGARLGTATTALVSRSMGYNFYLFTSVGSLTTRLYELLTGASSLEPQDLLGGYSFTTLELKLIAYPLENYCFNQSRQYFSTLRYGSTKRELIAGALIRMREIDQHQEDSLFAKMVKIRAVLDGLRQYPALSVSGSESKRAIDTATQIQIGLIEELPLPSSRLMITSGSSQIIEEYQPSASHIASSSMSDEAERGFAI